MSIKSYLILCLGLSLFWTGCDENSFQKDIEIDLPDHEPKLAISSHLTFGESKFLVYVNSSLGVLDNQELKGLEDATVQLYLNGELKYTLPSLYDPMSSFFYPEGTYGLIDLPEDAFSLGNYELRVSAPGFDEATAQQTAAAPVQLTNAEYIVSDVNEVEDQIVFEFNDPSSDKNYYAFEAFLFTRTNTGSSHLKRVDLEVEDDLVGEFSAIGPMLSDQAFDGQTKRISFNTFTEPVGSNSQNIAERYALIILRSITEDKFRFFRSLERYENSVDNPFAEPVIIHDNVQEGYGVFSVETRDTVKIVF